MDSNTEIMYQTLNGKIYAFAKIEDEIYFTKIDPKIKGNDEEVIKQIKEGNGINEKIDNT